MNGLWQALADLIRNIRPWATVRPWEKGVRVRCGRWVSEKPPGFYYKIPILDQFFVVNTRLRIVSTQMYTIRDAGGKPVSLSCKVAYRMTNPLTAFERYQQPDWTVNLMAARAMTQYVAHWKYEDIGQDKMENFIKDCLRDDAWDIEWAAVTDFSSVRTYRLLTHVHRPGVHGEQIDVASY